MRSFAVLAAAAGIASATSSAGWGAPVYVTDVVTAYTTYCPAATMISHNGVTYTVTEATTLTITNCPCTVTRPVSSAPATVAPVPSKSAVSSAVAPPPAPSASAKGTSVAPKASASASATVSAPATSYTGAANKVQVAGGVIAAVGLLAAAL